MAFQSPKFIVIRSDEKKEYLGFSHDNGKYDGYLEFSETEVTSPYAKFEVVEACGKDGMVHIRSCKSNKYLERTENSSITGGSAYWITATADKPVEDESKVSCTLFKLIPVDIVANKVRIMHVQSGCYLCLWRLATSRFMMASYKVFDGHARDIFTIIDWESLVMLPRYVAFKGDNGKYLSVFQFADRLFLKFGADDVSNPDVTMEIFVANDDGNVHIKHVSSGKFWTLDISDYLTVFSDDTSNNKDTSFRPFKVNSHSIALLNLGSNLFCRRSSVEDGFCANKEFTDSYARLQVVEPVTKREISIIKYDLDKSRVYDTEAILLVENSAINRDKNQSTTVDVMLDYKDVKSNIWNTNSPLKLETKATFDVNSFPIIGKDGKVELFDQEQLRNEFNETFITTFRKQVIHSVVVPPKTKVIVSLIATKGKCDVPFTFKQSDTLNNGNTFTTEMEGNIYTVSNYYNIEFKTREEPVNA